MVKKSGLGRGLSALMDDADIVKEHISGIAEVEVSKIEANPWQPRTTFDEEKLGELAMSIKEIGLIQPITLRKVDGDRYQIITGERRFRASQLAGLVKIPAFIREADNDAMLEMALVENIQREDLDPIEISISYQRLIDECNLTQESLGTRVGKKRSTVANYLRLLKLPASIQKGLRDRQITMGHAKALINVDEPDTQIMLFGQILKYDFSVRKIEEIVSQLGSDHKDVNGTKKKKEKVPEHLQTVKQLLDGIFPVPVKFLADHDGKGRIVIPFKSSDDLEKIVKILENRK